MIFECSIVDDYIVSNSFKVPVPTIEDPEMVLDFLLNGKCYDVSAEDGGAIDEGFFKYDEEKEVVEYFMRKGIFGVSVYIPFLIFIELLQNFKSDSDEDSSEDASEDISEDESEDASEDDNNKKEEDLSNEYSCDEESIDENSDEEDPIDKN